MCHQLNLLKNDGLVTFATGPHGNDVVNGSLVSFSDHSVIIIRDVDGVNTINPVWSSVSMYPFVFSIYLVVRDSCSGFCTTVLALVSMFITVKLVMSVCY